MIKQFYVLSCFCLLALVSVSLQAEKVQADEFKFESPAQEQMYRQIISQLRCPKCQNQSIADSDAELSEDLRFIVYQKIRRGESKQQIFSYFQQRYGDFILYDPPVSPKNYILWFMPIVVFIIIIIALVMKVGKRRVSDETEISEEQS